jgi:hypothetical protein
VDKEVENIVSTRSGAYIVWKEVFESLYLIGAESFSSVLDLVGPKIRIKKTGTFLQLRQQKKGQLPYHWISAVKRLLTAS